MASVRSIPRTETVIETTHQLSTNDGSVICLVKLNNFAAFLTDSQGNLRTSILEPNVRDYQGAGTSVNRDIRATLKDIDTKDEFWWLNNGVTILSEKCSTTGNKITITKPEIVNGLQTSHEVFEAFRGDLSRIDPRNILLRIIVAPEERSRNAIIKATNSQNPVSMLSLHATDRVHLDIEDRLKLYGLYYDRRKGQYKREKKPISRIISIGSLGQAVMAAYQQRPADARARPQTVLSRQELYEQIFNSGYNKDFYASCILLDRQVSTFLSSRNEYTRDVKVDIRYYSTMLAMCAITGSAAPTPGEISGIVEKVKVPIEESILAQCLTTVYDEYIKLGGTDKVAKGADLTLRLKEKLLETPGIPLRGA